MRIYIVSILAAMFMQLTMGVAMAQSGLSDNQRRADAAIARSDWALAYRFLEDDFDHNDQRRKDRALGLVRQYPQIVEAGILTFTPEEIASSIQSYGPATATKIEARRLHLLSLVAGLEVAKQALMNIPNAMPEFQRLQQVAKDQEALRREQLAKQEAARVREEKERRQSLEESERVRVAEAQKFDTLLNAKDPTVMYLAAGKLERTGESGKAQLVYERLIERFPASQWAVKANDQLLEKRRAEAYNSTTQRANAEAGERAFRACRIEVDTCYSRNGKNCFRDCERLR